MDPDLLPPVKLDDVQFDHDTISDTRDGAINQFISCLSVQIQRDPDLKRFKIFPDSRAPSSTRQIVQLPVTPVSIIPSYSIYQTANSHARDCRAQLHAKMEIDPGLASTVGTHRRQLKFFRQVVVKLQRLADILHTHRRRLDPGKDDEKQEYERCATTIESTEIALAGLAVRVEVQSEQLRQIIEAQVVVPRQEFSFAPSRMVFNAVMQQIEVEDLGELNMSKPDESFYEDSLLQLAMHSLQEWQAEVHRRAVASLRP